MDRDTVETLARLVRLRLDEAEAARAMERMERLLAYFAALQEVDTDNVEAAPYPVPLVLRWHDDVPEPALPREEVLANAPAVRQGAFVVPRVVEG